MTQNILDIYDRMYQASNGIKGETIDYNRGFQDAVYTLSHALRKYEHINLHIENRKLSHALKRAEIALDDRYEDREVLKEKIRGLERELKRHEKKVITISPKITPDLNKCQIEINGYKADFWVDVQQEVIDGLLPKVTDYIQEKVVKKKKNPQKSDYKSWCMQVLKDNGVKCVTS